MVEPTTIVFGMTQQLEVGRVHEGTLDEFFSQYFSVDHVDKRQQRQGIDRVFSMPECPEERWTVEYKADIRAATTNNLFIEVVSQDTNRVPGWAFTSRADWIVVFVPQHKTAYVFSCRLLRQLARLWLVNLPRGRARNTTYETHGVLLPLGDLSRCVAFLGKVHPIGRDSPDA